jgi:hypothetical protein
MRSPFRGEPARDRLGALGPPILDEANAWFIVHKVQETAKTTL